MYEVIGFRRCEGVSKKTGNKFSGWIVFFALVQRGVTGKACDQAFISDDLAYQPVLGDKVQMIYNSRGFLTDVAIGG